MRSRQAWRAGQVAAGLIIVLFVVDYVRRNWDEVRRAPVEWHLRPLTLLAGVAIVWAVFALLAEAWRRLVAAWGHPLGWVDGATIWMLSSMAKYVPGKVWALTGMAVMSERRKVPAWAALASAILLQILSIGTGALVVAGSGLAMVEGGGWIGRPALLVTALVAAAVIAVTLWPPITRRLVGGVAPGADLAHIPGLAPIGFGGVANALAWVGYGIAFWLFAEGSVPGAGLSLGDAVGAYTASYVAGVLAPFAPGGLGVREGVLVMALRERAGLGNALALAAVARLLTTLAEVLAAVPFLIRSREIHRG